MKEIPEKKPRELDAVLQAETEAFFAISRLWLYFLGLLALVLLGAMLGVALLLARAGRLIFLLPLVTVVAAGITALLCRSAAGRGALRTLGLGRSTGPRLAPRTQLRIWILASICALALASWMTLT